MSGINSRKLALALLASSALSTPAFAQADGTPPPREFVDQNGVDLASGGMWIKEPAVSIGTDQQGLFFQRNANRFYNTFTYSLNNTSTSATVTAQDRTIIFNLVGGVWVNQQGSGETLTLSGSNNWTFTDRNGAVVQLDLTQVPIVADYYKYIAGDNAIANTITFPNGEKWILTYNYVTKYNANLDQTTALIRLQSLQSTNGYMAKLQYASDTNVNYKQLTTVTLINSAVDYCNPSASSCTGLTQSWPTLTYVTSGGNTQVTVTDALGRVTRFTTNASLTNIVGIKRPTSASTDNTTITYGTDGRVSSVTTDGRTWNYSWSLSGTQLTSTTTNPDSTQRVVVSDTSKGQPISDRDELNRTTTFTTDTSGRITDVIFPEGNKRHYVYDARGNVTEARAISKTPGTPADIVATAGYDLTCTNPVKCNKPNSTTDARGNTTQYAYDATHGGIVSATSPPASGHTSCQIGDVCPQMRYAYTALQAYYKNSSGSIVASGQPTYVLTSTSACQTLSSCAGGADEAKTTISYGPQSAGTANNLLPVSTSSGSGDGALTATTALTYDSVGNLTYVDGPLSGSADTTRTLYDADREVIGQISPDPDGGGSLPNRAVRLTYNADGQVTKSENGTTAGQTDTAWAAFSAADNVDTAYDVSGRVTTQTLKNGSTSYALTQNSYDSLGRLDCSTVRMNPSVYGSLPSSACTLGTQGSYGPDRISQIVYDAASEPTELKVAVGTSDAATERTLAYSNNGIVASMIDGENNKTTYVYDGFGRRTVVQYPSATRGSGTSNPSDYEEVTYDANSNVTQRTRNGETLFYSYDNLDRVTLKDRPNPEADVTYGYDNLGRLTSASQSGNALSFGWDALSRKTSETGPNGTTSFAYDLADERTGVTYSTSGGGSALTVNYSWLPTGDLSTITQGANTLATYGYDNLGNRTSVTFGNGAAQAFTYDPVSRLASLTNDLSGTANDLSVTFAYNPTSQITQTVRTGDAYAWTGHGNGSTAYTQNGLNQQVSIGGSTATWDSKGNLTSEPQSGKAYSYSSDNLPYSASGGVSLSYDPALRLYQVAGAATTRFAYDETQAIAEYDGSGNLQRRFVFDPTTGQPVLQYEGTGAGTPRYLSQDERGSTIALTDGSGGLVAIDTYDEYGKPGSANIGRYQYTGQKWLSEANLYDYKTRDYMPHLGIFAQIDPAGPVDSPNLYEYALDDPIDNDDPSGLSCNDLAIAQGAIGITAACPGAGGQGSPSGSGSNGGDPSRGDPNRGCRGNCTPIPVVAPRFRPRLVFLPGLAPVLITKNPLRCAADQFGITAVLGASGAASGFNILTTRAKVAGAVPGTSLASRGARAIFGNARLGVRLPTVVGNPLGSSFAIRATSKVGTFVGRGIPVVGWGLLAYDAVMIVRCSES